MNWKPLKNFDPRLVPALLDGTKTMHVERIGPQPRWQEDPVLDDGHWVGRYQCQYYSPNSENGEVGVEVDAVKSPIQPGDVVFLEEDITSEFLKSPNIKDFGTSAVHRLARWHATVKSVEARRAKNITLEDTNKIYGSGPRDKFSETDLNSETWLWLYTFEKGE